MERTFRPYETLGFLGYLFRGLAPTATDISPLTGLFYCLNWDLCDFRDLWDKCIVFLIVGNPVIPLITVNHGQIK